MSEFINTIDALGDDAVIDSIIQGTITEFKDDTITTIASGALCSCASLEILDLPNATYFGGYSLLNTATTGVVSKVVFPNLTGMGNYTAQNAFKNKILAFPKLKEARYFYSTAKHFYMPALKKIGLFGARYYTKAVVISNTEELCVMETPNAFGGTPIYNIYGDTQNGYIYVPRAFLSDDDETKDYRRATNWSFYAADRFRAIEDYTVDGTVTGELDETKI